MVHQYKLNGYNIVLDTASGSVHAVDEVAYDIIEMYKSGELKPVDAKRLYEQGGITLDAIREILQSEDLEDTQKLVYANMLCNDTKVGKEFDPTYAQAVVVEKDETKESGVVLEVLQKGYMYKDRVLRIAMVKVNE